MAIEIRDHQELATMVHAYGNWKKIWTNVRLYPLQDVVKFGVELDLLNEALKVGGLDTTFSGIPSGDAIARDALWGFICQSKEHEQLNDVATEILVRRYVDAIDDDFQIFFPGKQDTESGN